MKRVTLRMVFSTMVFRSERKFRWEYFQSGDIGKLRCKINVFSKYGDSIMNEIEILKILRAKNISKRIKLISNYLY